MKARGPAALLLALLALAGVAGAAAETDLVPPTIGDRPPAASASTSASFTFTHTGLTAFQCSLDGAEFASCTSPTAYDLPEGGHTFAVRGVDGEGVPSEAATYAWTIDMTPPAAPVFTSPPARTGSTAQIAFTHGEAGLTFLCRLDDGPEDPCTSPKTFSGLAAGTHGVAVRMRDAAGNVGPAAGHSWTVDTAAPALTLTSPAGGSATNDTTPLISGTAGTQPGDGTTVGVQVRQGTTTGGQPFRSLTATVNPSTGAWGVPVTPELPAGTYNVKAEQSDDVGNTAETARIAFTIDVTPPAAPTVTGPPPRTNSTTANIGFTHGEAGLTFLCSLDGGAEEPCTSPKSYTGLAEGGHVAAVRARDAAGNVGPAASHAWTIDLTAPVPTIVSPANGSATNDGTPLVFGMAGRQLGDATTVRVQVRQGTATGGQPFRSLTATVNPASGTWSVLVGPDLPEGTYTVKAEQSDDAGNEGESAPRTFTVDLTQPAAPTVTGPPPRTRATTASIGFSHGEAGLTFLCRLDGGAEGPCTSPAAYGALGNGGHVASVRARDAAGNVGPAASHAWTVDATPPVPSLVSPSHGSSTNDTTPAISGTAGTATGDATTVHVQVRAGTATGGLPLRSLTAAVNQATGAWSVPVLPELAEGTYTVRAEQSDDVGNGSESGPSTFTIDLSVPSVALSAPANGTVAGERRPRFSGTSDQAAVVLDVFPGSTAVGSPLESTNVAVVAGSWSFTPADPLPDGLYTSVARTTNAAGTSSSSNAATFVIDNEAPEFTRVPESQTLEQTARTGEVVGYTAEAEDALDPNPKIDCAPSSGSTFPRGSTDVACKVTDWGGLSAAAGFTVTVENTIAPEPVSSFTARSRNGAVGLSWRRPTDWDRDRVIVSRAARGKSNWRVLLRTATATSLLDRSVVNDREYVYRVTSVDLAGNVSPVVTVGARPSAFLAPAWGATVLAPPLLRWTKVRRARYYNVQVWYRGRKVLSRWPARNRYGLSASWTFQGRRYTLKPGTYLAHVWPGFGPKARASYGARLGWTKFVVPSSR
jgi:hypothetical protein